MSQHSAAALPVENMTFDTLTHNINFELSDLGLRILKSARIYFKIMYLRVNNLNVNGHEDKIHGE